MAELSPSLAPLFESPSDGVNGGGLNSSVVVALPGGQLNDGESINVRFLLSVATPGIFRFYVNVEGIGDGLSSAPAPAAIGKDKRGTVRIGRK